MRMPAAADEVGDRESVRRDRLLGQDADAGGDGTCRQAGDVLTVEQHGAGRRREQAGKAAQQRRLATGVGADDRRHLAGRDRERETIDDHPVVVAERDVDGIELRMANRASSSSATVGRTGR